MFVGWIPESPEIPLYVFFIGDSANSLPHWALQAVGPAEQGKKDEHGRKLVNMNQIMGRIDNKQCWARDFKDRMTEQLANITTDRKKGVIMSSVLRTAYCQQEKIPEGPSKSKKRKRRSGGAASMPDTEVADPRSKNQKMRDRAARMPDTEVTDTHSKNQRVMDGVARMPDTEVTDAHSKNQRMRDGAAGGMKRANIVRGETQEEDEPVCPSVSIYGYYCTKRANSQKRQMNLLGSPSGRMKQKPHNNRTKLSTQSCRRQWHI